MVCRLMVVKGTDTAGFEPTRLTPFDFKSNSLTTRTSILLTDFLNNILHNLIKYHIIAYFLSN